MEQRRQLTPDEFFRGLMAATAVAGSTTLNGTRPQIHRAFRKVIEMLQERPFTDRLSVDTFDIDFDPLYGQSSWLDRMLARAQRGRVISFPNPTYERMQVKYDTDEAADILAELGDADVFEQLARVFTSELPNGTCTTATS